jgi:hypothetical protein
MELKKMAREYANSVDKLVYCEDTLDSLHGFNEFITIETFETIIESLAMSYGYMSRRGL